MNKSNWREATEQIYPLAGHAGDCAKVTTASAVGVLTAVCTCGWDDERQPLLAAESDASDGEDRKA